jgi:hypothetical protein
LRLAASNALRKGRKVRNPVAGRKRLETLVGRLIVKVEMANPLRNLQRERRLAEGELAASHHRVLEVRLRGPAMLED